MKKTFNSAGINIDTEIFAPTGVQSGGVIVIAYGSDGMAPPWGPMIQSYAEELAKNAFVVSIPHYFQRTNTPDAWGLRN